jgi:hypothetical protein
MTSSENPAICPIHHAQRGDDRDDAEQGDAKRSRRPGSAANRRNDEPGKHSHARQSERDSRGVGFERTSKMTANEPTDRRRHPAGRARLSRQPHIGARGEAELNMRAASRWIGRQSNRDDKDEYDRRDQNDRDQTRLAIAASRSGDETRSRSQPFPSGIPSKKRHEVVPCETTREAPSRRAMN